jgi:hypothetical protein
MRLQCPGEIAPAERPWSVVSDSYLPLDDSYVAAS